MPQDPSAAPHLNPPKQARSRRTLDRIARAALELIEEKGVEGTTVKDVVDRADSSVGSFYARFPGKEELLLYLQARVWHRAREAWDEAMESRDWDELDLEHLVKEVVRVLLDSQQEEAGRRHALGEHARVRGAEDDPEEAFHRHVLDDLRRMVLARSEQVLHPSPELAVELGYRITVGALRELSAMEEARGRVLGTRIIADEVARGYLAYLGVEGLPVRDVHEGRADFGDPFDIWG